MYTAEGGDVYIQGDRDIVATFHEGSMPELYDTHVHSEFYAFASNLAQRVNLEEVEGTIIKLKKIILGIDGLIMNEIIDLDTLRWIKNDISKEINKLKLKPKP